MELLIGGCFQGKLEYARRKLEERHIVLEEENIGDGACLEELLAGQGAGDVKVVCRLHLFAGKCVEEGRTEAIIPALERLLAVRPDVILICDEVGYGIVPAERRERRYREAVGRMLCFLAGRAESMERVVAGMPVRIK